MNPTDHEITIHEEERGVFLLIKLAGSFTAHNLLKVRKTFEAAGHIGHNKFAVDLSGVNHMDSTGLGLLINFSRLTEKEGGTLVVFNPAPSIQKVLDAVNAQKSLRLVNASEEQMDHHFE